MNERQKMKVFTDTRTEQDRVRINTDIQVISEEKEFGIYKSYRSHTLTQHTSLFYTYNIELEVKFVIAITQHGHLSDIYQKNRVEFALEITGHCYLWWPAGTRSAGNENQPQKCPTVVSTWAARNSVCSVWYLDPHIPPRAQVDHVGCESGRYTTVTILTPKRSHRGLCLELYGTGITLPRAVMLDLEVVEDCDPLCD